ncbi:LrgB family protein [Endozoicomonas sp. ONNA2]|uniref:LrgB family protein n=1 Tax=Endozoicomonas sp. ONNA2 TaxID=2828741 RepID=UPI002147E312|nr:LrgB family protein [Endozoicomonas sp. ONNA2]
MDEVFSSSYGLLQRQINNPVAILLINLGAYLLAEKFFNRMGRKGWFHPLFTTSLLVFLVIRYSPLEFNMYTRHSELLKILLAPFTVSLAVPLARQLHTLRQLAGPLLCALLIGGFLAVFMGMGLALATGGSRDVVLSISTKAVTTAVALVMGEQYGFIIPLVAAVVIISGVYGSLVGPALCRKFGVTDPRAIGFAMGVNAHAGGTARSFELDLTMGVYSSLGMCLCAIYMPLLVPWLITLMYGLS